MRPIFPFLASVALLVPTTALAQEAPADASITVQKAEKADKPAKRSDVFKAKNEKLPVSVKDKTDKKAREALEKIKVSLELKSSDPDEAFFSLIKQIGVDYAIDPAFYPFGADDLDLPERALNMKLTNASAARALDSFCEALGVGWWAEKHDSSVLVHLVKLQGTMGKMDMLSELGVDVRGIAELATNAAKMGADMELAMGALGLPDKRVKADATSPRDIKSLIEDLCKQGGVVFAIDSDVPSTSKALVFENVPLRIALETLCATANLSMSVSKKGEKTVITFSKAETPKE